ncbi:alpha/beta hydrolase family protein [Candidatus Phyllobacterium onerii]|uniref:alpha/beta hydrolase family protein n=1 Tax=Candidatus Phyllobacterium onerii TaxID=3020828 RepID=UPI00232CECCB|nr:hypothetical protein [Phyllobacterium sp. IY22]
MTQWLKPGTRLACRLAQTACISALLAATLSGCNEDKTSSDTTFDVPAVKTVVTAEVPKDEPVKGTVTVGKPAQDPVTTGGFAIPLATKVGRFTEIAPDTAGGATFRSSPEMDYDLGNLVASVANDLTSASDDKFFISQVAGWIRYPQDPKPLAPKGRFPVIVFEHGQHSPSDPSYKGYDYLAEELASHGYVVLSVDGNAINGNWGGDKQGQARAQLILGTLDRLQQIDELGQVDESGEAGPLNFLKGKLDFTRVGIMGHSRGGQGVSNAIKYNQTRVGVSPGDLKKALEDHPDFFANDYPDLVAAVTPATTQPVVTPAVAKIEKVVPAHFDEAKFKIAYEKSKETPLVGGLLPDAEATKALLLSGQFPLGGFFPDLLATVIPATTEMVEKEPTVSIDEAKFKTAYDKSKESPLVGGLLPDAEATKTLLLAGHFPLGGFFPDLLATIIPAIIQPVAEDNSNENNEETQSNDSAKMTFEDAVKKYNIFYAAGRETIPPYDFKGAFMLAPMDNNGNLGVNNVPLANLLPTCDGDVSSLYGARSYDHNRFGPITDTAPRYQIQVFGANHNFYNTEWWEDDFDSGGTSYCADDRPGSIRLNRVDQRRGGSFLINSFMRYHVGGEQKFAAYWNGTAQLPGAACPSTDGPCDERIVLTVQKGAPSRKLIARFARDESATENEFGGAITLKGFDASARCEMPIGPSYLVPGFWYAATKYPIGDCLPGLLPGFEYGDGGMLSIADHLELAWSAKEPSVVTDLKGLSAKGMDSLTFRIGVVRPMGQEVEVTLTDSAGRTAMLKASDFSNATYNAPRKKSDEEPAVTHLDGGEDKKATSIPMVDHPDDSPFADGQVKILMNMVAIPLKAFEGIDLTSLKELKLVFPKESGKVAITDIELQNLGREKPSQKLAKQ